MPTQSKDPLACTASTVETRDLADAKEILLRVTFSRQTVDALRRRPDGKPGAFPEGAFQNAMRGAVERFIVDRKAGRLGFTLGGDGDD